MRLLSSTTTFARPVGKERRGEKGRERKISAPSPELLFCCFHSCYLRTKGKKKRGKRNSHRAILTFLFGLSDPRSYEHYTDSADFAHPLEKGKRGKEKKRTANRASLRPLREAARSTGSAGSRYRPRSEQDQRGGEEERGKGSRIFVLQRSPLLKVSLRQYPISRLQISKRPARGREEKKGKRGGRAEGELDFALCSWRRKKSGSNRRLHRRSNGARSSAERSNQEGKKREEGKGGRSTSGDTEPNQSMPSRFLYRSRGKAVLTPLLISTSLISAPRQKSQEKERKKKKKKGGEEGEESRHCRHS